jgi:sensor histidine kinase regulating citrate/malate metabolism
MSFYGVHANSLVANFIPLVLSTLLLAFAYYLIARSINQTKRHQALEKQLALQRDHYQNLSNSIADTKAIRHDLRHHLVTIAEFLGNNNTSAAQEYLNQLSCNYDDSFLPIVCSNKSANALISHYLKIAKQLNIAIVTELHLPDDLGIDDLDLCVILGNCLENAIEACSKIGGDEPRRIDIKSKISKGHLLITITNSFNGLVLHQGGEGLLSTKKGTGHGIGLSSVKAVADKYSGHLASSFDQKVFKVSVSLKLPKEWQHMITG